MSNRNGNRKPGSSSATTLVAPGVRKWVEETAKASGLSHHQVIEAALRAAMERRRSVEAPPETTEPDWIISGNERTGIATAEDGSYVLISTGREHLPATPITIADALDWAASIYETNDSCSIGDLPELLRDAARVIWRSNLANATKVTFAIETEAGPAQPPADQH